MNYLIVLFKNKVKKKIIKKFKTSNRANNFYESLLVNSNNVIFNKQYENGFLFNYEIAILEKISGTLLPVFLKDELGRNVKVNLENEDFSIRKITSYYVEELILDTTLNKKINSFEFIFLFKDVSKINSSTWYGLIFFIEKSSSSKLTLMFLPSSSFKNTGKKVPDTFSSIEIS
jgi:hypothetical protein